MSIDRKIRNKLIAGLVMGLLVVVSSGAGNAKTRKVRCDKGQSLQKKVDKAKPGDTVLITGVCNENVLVGADKSDLLLLGGDEGAGISGPDASRSSIIRRSSSGVLTPRSCASRERHTGLRPVPAT